MKNVIEWLVKRWRPPEGDAFEAVASLVLAARDDHEFRGRLLAVLRLPIEHRRPMLLTAIDQMNLRGESPSAQRAFAALATEDGARVALRLLQPDEKNA